ncbi:solute carrier family 22 member 21-like isoform X2 [Ostrinia furnacalis]|uniref:solute carrier family 22 member 21-like isoform X2 n=1 Tax=Ostrinia furnacalis TaxID=93504 RepID=UPI00103D9349|nr:solute carrier family 22 member 21-like isoform X2 [Ostrinia furnacalis]
MQDDKIGDAEKVTFEEALSKTGSILGAIVWGYWADQHGRRRTLILSLLLGAAINMVSSLSVDWVMLLVLQFIASLMIAGQYSLAMTLLSECVPIDRRTIVVMMVSSIYLLSQGTMAVLAMPIIPLSFSFYLPYLDIQFNSWRLLLVIYSVPSVLTAVWLYFMQESPKFVYSKGREQKALQILKIIHGINNRRSLQEYPVKCLTRRRSHTEGAVTTVNHITPLFRKPLLKYTIIMNLLFLLDQLSAFKVWLPTIANHFMQTSHTGNGTHLNLCDIIATSVKDSEESSGTCALNSSALVIVLVVGVILSLTNTAVSLLVSRVGRRNLAMAITAVCGASGVLVNLVPYSAASAALFVLQLMGIVVFGLYTAMCVAFFPTYMRALAVTLTMTGSRIANFISIQLINYLLTNNCEIAFYVYGSALAFSTVIASFLPNDHRTRTTQHEILEEEVADGSIDSF